MTKVLHILDCENFSFFSAMSMLKQQAKSWFNIFKYLYMNKYEMLQLMSYIRKLTNESFCKNITFIATENSLLF